MRKLFALFLLLILCSPSWAQLRISGTVTERNQEPIAGVLVYPKGGSTYVQTDSLGKYSIELAIDSVFILQYRLLGYKTESKIIDSTTSKIIDPKRGKEWIIDVVLDKDNRLLEAIEINRRMLQAEPAGIIRLDPEKAKAMPTPFQDFNKVLSTLPGVRSNNELSSNYAVRGGNFDENLVYVNGMQIYRPFLARSGQQEGLSFINPDMVKSIEFSAGGWEAKYGDKLSSNLTIQYKTPEKFGASGTFGMLGGTAHVEGVSANQRLTYIAGVRHKNSRYLLNTLPTQGTYRPRFTDFQSFIEYKLNDPADKPASKLGLLASYAQNQYRLSPVSQTTNFGTFEQAFRLSVGFEGQEQMNYDIAQSGLRLKHWFTNKFQTEWVISGLYTVEREAFDIEGAYWLSDVDNNPQSTTFGEPLETLGVGTNYKYSRNALQATIFNFYQRSQWAVSNAQTLEFGFGASHEQIEDRLNEYSFVDSAGYVHMGEVLKTDISLSSYRLRAYGQYNIDLNQHIFTAGARVNYWSLNKQLLFSPRIQYNWQPDWKRQWSFKMALGLYQQPPFYRELRSRQGIINKELQAQQSFHAIAGADYIFSLWDRNFKLLTEAYYKKLWNVVPYDIDDVRIVYHAHNDAKAYAAGLDFRLNGEFIPGTESWFSLGLLTTEEDLETDNAGYIRRPSDQRLNIGMSFEDHIPGDPSLRVNLNFVYGSGLPFGPPAAPDSRSIYITGDYKRVDIGFSKGFRWLQKEREDFIVGLDILNLLGTNNPVSYTWLKDFNNRQFAVPNNLSQRFWNVKISVKI